MQETQVQSPGQEDPLEENTITHFQYSCLKNPTDRGAWWDTIHRVAKRRDWNDLAHTHTSHTKQGVLNIFCYTILFVHFNKENHKLLTLLQKGNSTSKNICVLFKNLLTPIHSPLYSSTSWDLEGKFAFITVIVRQEAVNLAGHLQGDINQ